MTSMMNKTFRGLAGALALTAAANAAAATAGSAPDAVAPSAATLRMDKQGLRLLDAQGQQRDTLALRSKRWDQRLLPDGRRVALLHDADSNVLLLVEARDGRLRERRRWPGPAMNLEALCLYLPSGQPDQLQVFLIGDDGLAEQWLLAEGDRPPLMRRLASAPEAEGCTVRDAQARLYVLEPEVGLWSQAADAERQDRRLVAPGLGEKGLKDWFAAHPEVPVERLPVVTPSAQTAPVRGSGDAADDPAIWVRKDRPALSRILGTDKKLGLSVYDLQGRETQFLPVGRINNVDLRQGLRYEGPGGRTRDLASASQRDRRSVVLFDIAANGHVSTLAELPTELDDVYGLCSARNPAGGYDVFVNDKDGRLHQLRVTRHDGQWRSDIVARHRFDSQPEGCVADEAGRQLFVGEEKRGVWRLALDDGGLIGDARLVLPVGDTLKADVEGLAVHRGPRGARLVVSAQGDDSYTVLEADAPHRVLGRFRIGLNVARGIDGVSETDGLDVTSANLGGEYRDGLLVVQDGHKRWPQDRQNFKLVPWSAVERVIPAR